MSRNRVIYNVLALYAGQNDAVTGSHSTSGSIAQLTRVQSFDEDFSRNFKEVVQYGNLAAIDYIETESPTVKGSYSYYITDGSQEKYAGLTVYKGASAPVSCVSGMITKATDQKNYFLLIANEGFDANGYTSSTTGVIGLGNAYMTDYTVEAAVGQIPKATVALEALNVAIYAAVNGSDIVPAIDPSTGFPVTSVPFVLPPFTTNDSTTEVSALQPGDIKMVVNGLKSVSSVPTVARIQNFKLNVPIGRESVQGLGSHYSLSREIKFPVKATFSIDATMSDIASMNLYNIICDTGLYSSTVYIAKQNCSGLGAGAIAYTFAGSKLMSEKISTTVGGDAKFTAEFETYLGAASDVTHGVFISGTCAN